LHHRLISVSIVAAGWFASWNPVVDSRIPNRRSITNGAGGRTMDPGRIEILPFREEASGKKAARDSQWKRIEAVVGTDESATFEQQVAAFYQHLRQSLELPCDVRGIEDFRWEEPYLLGGWSQTEYKRLKRTQPSYRDRFELLEIKDGVWSEWMLFGGDDIGARVRRRLDGKEFWLGLSELKAVKKDSPNAQLLHDFGVFFANSR
jgi:hypothetical protein